MDFGTVETMLSTTLRMLPPILLAGLGGMITSRVGLLNMGLEGMMLIGSFSAVLASYYTGSAYLALVGAALVGGLLGLLFAVFNIRYKADNVVVSVAVNMLAAGLTSYLLKAMFGVRGAFSSPRIVGLPNIRIPLLENIPLLRALSGHSLLVYLSFVAVIYFQYLLYHTPTGLRIRATGSHDMAVTTAGVNVKLLRYVTITLSGVLCGLGGAHLSLGQLTMFTDEMTSGRGFIAMAANQFGRSTPIGTFLGSVLFSFTDAATMKIQTSGFPPLLIQMLPYVFTLLTLLAIGVQERRRRQRAVKEPAEVH